MAPPAAAFGRLVAAYSRAVATSALVEIIPETPLPQSPTLWISWHENNLITLALHRRVTGRAAVAFVPPGAQGIAMSTWLSGVGVTPVPLVGDARRGLGLRQMEAALASGKDVLIAGGWPDRATPRDCARRAVACPGDGRGDQAGRLLGIARA